MFLQDFVDVERPRDVISERLASGGRWLERLASAAGDDTQTQLVRMGPPLFGDWIAREVRIRLGSPTVSDSGVVVPIRWEDARRPTFFPVLDGNLELVALGPECCRIVLYASYRPPFETVGHVLDSALLHRVAESTVRSFLTQVAQTLGTTPPQLLDTADPGDPAAG